MRMPGAHTTFNGVFAAHRKKNVERVQRSCAVVD
jgi:hypothetical protein